MQKQLTYPLQLPDKKTFCNYKTDSLDCDMATYDGIGERNENTKCKNA